MLKQLPAALAALLEEQYGEEIAQKIASGLCRRPVTLRANTLKASAEEIKIELEKHFEINSPEWSDCAFIIKNASEDDVRPLDIYKDGKIYLQSLSSMIPPLLIEPAARECILDMCAAPGGKTTQLAALSGNKADITACEKNRIRADRLRYNLNKQGANRVSVMVADSRRLDEMFSFDKILLDAPCSGSGTIVPPFEDFSVELYERSVRTQEELLKKALKLLKPGHKMVYSTCSILTEENCGILKRVLPIFGAKVVPIPKERFPGVPLLPTDLPGTLSICPSPLYEGFFAAVIEKAK